LRHLRQKTASFEQKETQGARDKRRRRKLESRTGMTPPRHHGTTDVLSSIGSVDEASTAEDVLRVFDNAIAQMGADYFSVTYLPRPEQRIEDVCLAWKAPPAWRALYSGENFVQRDAAIRHCRHTVFPFDWASAPYDPETEPQVKEVIDRARDFNLHRAIVIPIPNPSGIIGRIGVGGPDFNDREIYKPVLHSLALHAFYRLEQFVGSKTRTPVLTHREREILAWASEGKTAWETGCILKLSQRTVEWHLRQVCKKLGATNRLQALAILGGRSAPRQPSLSGATPFLKRYHPWRS
jgi:LuxR family quorum sensing-dependent transcriptional regulator